MNAKGIVLLCLGCLILGGVATGILCYHLGRRGLSDALEDNRRLTARVLELETSLENISAGLEGVASGIAPIVTGLGDSAERAGRVAANLGRAEAILRASKVLE
jgi:hypothetical protein